HIVLTSLLVEQFTQAGGTVEDMVVLDMGAGSGLVAKTLADLGVKSIVGTLFPKQQKLLNVSILGFTRITMWGIWLI
ncbi:MAG: hypothetical protein F6K53_36280, partial [Moorea sp. SIO4A1]|nr:hypothetical protein [Moorena sp. SIO4A1]